MVSLFGKGSRKSAPYRQLHQSDSDLSDTDEDEKVIFRKPGDLQLNLVPDHGFRRSRHKSESRARCKTICVACCLVVIGLVAVLALVISYQLKTHRTHNVRKPCETCDWNVTLKGYKTENGLNLLDVDGDGREDLVFSVGVTKIMGAATDAATNIPPSSYKFYKTMHEICAIIGEPYPCVGMVLALRGYDGKELWRLRVRSNLFVINCDEFDLTGDGKMDCIGTGRMGTIVAFNPYTGKQLWTTENDAYLRSEWNTYKARPLPDWDGDGIPEVLIANGGDPGKRAEDLDRAAGRLVVLSGKTGHPLTDRYLEMPHSKETYMSPVLYRQTDTSPAYILFGSGGETIPGDLMGISVADFCRFILGPDHPKCPQPSNITWDHLDSQKDGNGTFVILSSKGKGVMVPPVIVDVNKDGIMDVFVSLFSGSVVLLDGKSFKPLWTVQYPEHESYSTPAPGYFDDDDVLDFMMHWNLGQWETDYKESFSVALSGKDGSELWRSKSVKDIQASNLIISTNQTHHDFFIYRSLRHTFQQNTLGQRRRRHENSGRLQNGPSPQAMGVGPDLSIKTCSELNQPRTEDVFLLDPSTIDAPLKLLELYPAEHYYNPYELSMKTNMLGKIRVDITASKNETIDGTSRHLQTVGGHHVRLHKPPNDPGIGNRFSDLKTHGDQVHDAGQVKSSDRTESISEKPEPSADKTGPSQEDTGESPSQNKDANAGNHMDNGSGLGHMTNGAKGEMTGGGMNQNNPPMQGMDNAHNGNPEEYNGVIEHQEKTLDNINRDLGRADTQEPQNDEPESEDHLSEDERTGGREKGGSGQEDEGSGHEGGGSGREGGGAAREKRENSKAAVSDTQFCSYSIPDGTTTGAIGDVDGDGLIDYISIVPYQANLFDPKYDNVAFDSNTVIHKIGVEKLWRNQPRQTNFGDVKQLHKTDKIYTQEKDLAFLPANQQKWTKYMGAKGNNWYT